MPFTSKSYNGVTVPIPTLPLVIILKNDVTALLLVIYNGMLLPLLPYISKNACCPDD